MKVKNLLAATLIFATNIAYAAPSDLKALIYDIIIGKIINPAIAITVALIMLFFFYNSATYLFKSNKSAEEKKKIMESLMWSVIVLFVLASVWGLVRLIANTLSIEVSI